MKPGDNIVVSMAGFDVAQAVIEEIEDGKAVIYIPATRVVMGVAQSLTDLAPEVDREFAGIVDEDTSTSESVDMVNNASRTTQHSDDIGEGLSNVKLDSSAID